MSRSFDIGRQSELLYGDKLYELYEILQHFLDVPVNVNEGPVAEREGALWLDRLTGDLKYYRGDRWEVISSNRFRAVGEILNEELPSNPVTGQLWIDSNGIMQYYDGMTWQIVKAPVASDTEFNPASFENFLLINPLTVAGEPLVDGYSQFILPNTTTDKFFIDNLYIKPTIVSNIAVKHPTVDITNAITSAVHINPSRIMGISKKLVKIDPVKPVVKVPETNTEYYAFSGGVGRLLVKSNDAKTNYTSMADGIELTATTALNTDFVLALTYKFANAKNEGKLVKGQVTLSGNNSVYVGTVSDPGTMCVFVSGFYLDPSGNYTYNSSNGFVQISGIDSRMDIGIMTFPRKEVGVIGSVDGSNGIINLTNPETVYNRPMVFVAGEGLSYTLADFTVSPDNMTISVVNGVVGMKYAVVETEDPSINTYMFAKSGLVPNPTIPGDQAVIPCTIEELPAEASPILFVDGILIAQKDIIRNPDNSLTVNGLMPGQEYTLLKDLYDRILFDDVISYTTIPTDFIDDALVYVENHLICNSSAVYVTKLPDSAVDGELRLLLEGGVDKWYVYKESLKQWQLVNTSDGGLMAKLNAIPSYANSDKSISILQDLGAGKVCNYYGYRFANSVEQPLLRGTVSSDGTKSQFKVGYKHIYQVGANTLNVWVDGVRQYYTTELDSSTFVLPELIKGNIFYVIERLEGKEVRACQRDIIGPERRLVGTANIFSSTIPLYPGNLRVFISGYRQPPSAYRVLDPYTIMIKDTILGGNDNYPIETVDTPNGAVDITHTRPDLILIETRDDYSLREITLPIRYAGQKEWSIAEDKIPAALLDSTDFIMIYINGAAYGPEYAIDRDRGVITLTNIDVTSKLGIDPIEQYYRENPHKDPGNYVPRPITDTITFEWR